MSLLRKHSVQRLKQLVEQYRAAGTSDEQMLELFGAQPYYWEHRRSPSYAQFVPSYRDDAGREYSPVAQSLMAVRLPIAKNRERTLEMPLAGQTLRLVEVGGGNTLHLEVISLSVERHRHSTAWFEYRVC
jgi:hypothetical protein